MPDTLHEYSKLTARRRKTRKTHHAILILPACLLFFNSSSPLKEKIYLEDMKVSDPKRRFTIFGVFCV
jgi:hypothetical protein